MTCVKRISVLAPAKINLCLHVGWEREDGYHDLESFVTFADYGDRIFLEGADEMSVSVVGPFASGLPDSSDNIVLRAAGLLAGQSKVARGARITLQKNLPVASGLGGGSADAAAILRGLSIIWDCGLERKEMHELANSLGADVPVCLYSVTAWIEGRGERVATLPPLPKLPLLLVNPALPLSTAEVFSRLDRRAGVGLALPQARFDDGRSLAAFLRSTTNDLETPARLMAPEIGNVLEEIAGMRGCHIARMSGSGATCFGIFGNRKSLRLAALLLRQSHPQWWVIETEIASDGIGTPVHLQ